MKQSSTLLTHSRLLYWNQFKLIYFIIFYLKWNLKIFSQNAKVYSKINCFHSKKFILIYYFDLIFVTIFWNRFMCREARIFLSRCIDILVKCFKEKNVSDHSLKRLKAQCSSLASSWSSSPDPRGIAWRLCSWRATSCASY
jgi:hypothetical protein